MKEEVSDIERAGRKMGIKEGRNEKTIWKCPPLTIKTMCYDFFLLFEAFSIFSHLYAKNHVAKLIRGKKIRFQEIYLLLTDWARRN